MRIRIATRKSRLALWQAEHVAQLIKRLEPTIEVELVKVTTKGDKILDAPLAKIGGKGLFTKEIDAAVLEGRADCAVHSMKDVPTELPQGIVIAAIPEREEAGDVVATVTGKGLESLAEGARVGTSSLRRTAQLRKHYPHLSFVPLRGNVETRLGKLGREVEAVVLAAAGVKRLGLWHRVHARLDPETILPAVGQGALAIATREDDERMRALLARLDHAPSRACVEAERAFLHRLEGGCQAPIAAYATLCGNTIQLRGMVGELDGSTLIRREQSGDRTNPQALGEALANEVLAAGGKAILDRIYGRKPAA